MVIGNNRKIVFVKLQFVLTSVEDSFQLFLKKLMIENTVVKKSDLPERFFKGLIGISHFVLVFHLG